VPTLSDAGCTRDITARGGDGAVPLLALLQLRTGPGRRPARARVVVPAGTATPSAERAVRCRRRARARRGWVCPYAPSLLTRATQHLRQEPPLLIVDEVHGEFGRTERMFNIEIAGATRLPDYG